VCSTRDGLSETVLALVPDELRVKGLFPAGRLDKDSRGFVFLTDDGALAHRILSPKKHLTKYYLVKLWEEYKDYCNNKTTVKTAFSAKEGRSIEGVVSTPISFTIEGFCLYIGLNRKNFYETYDNLEEYRYITTRIREEVEQDAREKFETETLPSKLAGLWMSRYENYNNKQDINVNGSMSVEDKALLEKINKRLEKEN
jgi:hypothetical protein